MTYNKLIRDRIPDMIRQNGETPVVRVLGDEEYRHCLERKLDEEVEEFHQDRNLEELADILEVVNALAESLGADREELLEVYRRNNQQRGGFGERYFLISKV